MRERGGTITAFYTSNVEQYLFQQADDWRKFYENVATLPVDSTSAFIRSLSSGYVPVAASPNGRSIQLTSSILEQIRAFTERRLSAYWDVIQMSR